PPDGGLAGARQSDEYRLGCHHADPDARAAGASRSATARWYASMLRRVSVSESPPNFCSTARASTNATMVSTTTPAAGTAHTSERWWMATGSSPVALITVARARGPVGD